LALSLTRATLPLTFDEITPEWMSLALSERFPGVKVAAVARDAERAGTSSSARFTLDYASDDGHAGLPAAVYVKGGFDPDMRRRTWAALIQESTFYARFGAEVPVRTADVYFAGVDEDARQGILVLEDMTTRGVHFCRVTDTVTIDFAAKVMEEMAKLHAHFWDDPRLDAQRDWTRPQRVYLSWLMRQKHWDACHQRPYAAMISNVLPSAEYGHAALDALWRINDAQARTLLHGDTHCGNLFFDANGDLGFIDWQLGFTGATGHEHAMFFHSALSTQDRRSSERDLIAHYREVLVASGVDDAPSFDALFLSYRQNNVHTAVSGAFNPYDMQPQDVTDLSATRALQAAMDLDAFSAVGMAT